MVPKHWQLSRIQQNQTLASHLKKAHMHTHSRSRVLNGWQTDWLRATVTGAALLLIPIRFPPRSVLSAILQKSQVGGEERVWSVKVPLGWWNVVGFFIKFIMSIFSHSCNSKRVFKCSGVTACAWGAKLGKWYHTVRLSCPLQLEWIMIVIRMNPGSPHESLRVKDDLSYSLSVCVSMIPGTAS